MEPCDHLGRIINIDDYVVFYNNIYQVKKLGTATHPEGRAFPSANCSLRIYGKETGYKHTRTYEVFKLDSEEVTQYFHARQRMQLYHQQRYKELQIANLEKIAREKQLQNELHNGSGI